MSGLRSRPPVAWLPLTGLVAAKLALHAWSAGVAAWGYMTDELYFLDSLDRLSWGYVDHPALSVAVLAPVRALLGDSIAALRVLPALCGAATLVLTALAAREMGGGRSAQVLAGLAILCSPVPLAMSAYHSMNAIDHALWAGACVLFLRILGGGDPRLWLALGAAVGLALTNKLSALWLGAGVAVGLAVTPARRWLATPWPWAAGAVAVLCLLPYAVWNAQHGWPFLEFTRNAAADKVGHVSPLELAGQQLLAMGPTLAPLWLAGGIWLLAASAGRPFRPAAWIFITSFGILAASGSARAHYLAPAFPVLLAAGGVATERASRARRWLAPALAAAILLGGVVAAPLAMPLLPPETTLAWQRALGVDAPEERDETGVFALHLALLFHAEAVLAPVQRVYESLPPAERARAEILTGSFGETGAINVLGTRLGLPRSIGTQNQYALWGPGDATGELMIVVHESESELARWFVSCERRAEIDCPFCMPAIDAKAVFLCRDARRPLRELWPEMTEYR